MQSLKFCLFFLFTSIGVAQNLVPNPGFEESNDCPWTISELRKAEIWIVPNLSTPDYFCDCEAKRRKSNVKVPSNIFGYQPARDGICYTGMILHDPRRDYREFMSVRLKEQLSEGWYEMSFYYSLANYSAFQVDSLGVMFTDTIAEGRTAGLTKNFRPQLTRGIKNDTLEWQLFAGYFKASGNERYLTIGTPKRSRARGRKRTTVPPYIPTIADKGKFAYYFFDAVSLTRKEPAVKVEKKTVATGTPVIPQASLPHKGVFEEITFDNNKSELPRSSYKELDDLVKYLKENESLNLMLEGHTDDNGSEKDNLILSEKRAAAVASYITSRGVSATRVLYKGYGSSRPLKPNDSEENRRTNRRVQFILE